MVAPIPNVTQTTKDKGLGSASAVVADVFALMGNTSGGVANVWTLYAGGQITKLVADYGYGPLTQKAALHLAAGQSVLVCKLPDTTPGDEGTDGIDNATTVVGGGTSVITLTGTARDKQRFLITFLTGGTIGVTGITFTYSLDAGVTTSAVQSLGVANTFLIPNTGITLAFAAGTIIANQTNTFVSTAPKWASGDLAAAFTSLKAQANKWDLLHIVGNCSASEAATVKSQLATLDTTDKIFVSALLDARGPTTVETDATWQTSIIADYAATSADRIVVGAGLVSIVSPVDGYTYLRPISWVAAVRAAAVKPHIDLAKKKLGPVNGTIFDSTNTQIAGTHNEQTQPGLNVARFMTARTFPGSTKLYITNPNTMADAGSDFDLWQYRRVMDKACAIVQDVLTDELSNDIEVDATTGFIIEKDALAVESVAKTKLNDALAKQGSINFVDAKASPATGLILMRNDNILSTKTVTSDTRIVPKGYIKVINNTNSFVNPALQPTPV